MKDPNLCLSYLNAGTKLTDTDMDTPSEPWEDFTYEM